MKLILAIGLCFTLFSCGKNGTGGKAQINVHVIHDNVNIPYAIVQLKYGATGKPANGSSYDELDTCDHTGKESFKNLKPGDYYVYVTHMPDTGSTMMTGGKHVKIENRIGEQHIVIDLSK